MALDKSGNPFSVEDRLSRNRRVSESVHTDAASKESTGTPTESDKSTLTLTHEYTPAHSRAPKVKERKTERLQLVVRPSTKARLAQYAEDHDTSSNEVVQKLLDQLLDSSGY